MPYMTRRTFLAAGAAGAANWSPILAAARGSGSVDDTLRSGIERRKIPAITLSAGQRTIATVAVQMR